MHIVNVKYIPLCMWNNRKNNNRYSCDCAPFARTDRRMSDRVPYCKEKMFIFITIKH